MHKKIWKKFSNAKFKSGRIKMQDIILYKNKNNYSFCFT
jgi:hypothetical protein